MIKKITGGGLVWLGGALLALHDQLTFETKKTQLAPGTVLISAGLVLLRQ